MLSKNWIKKLETDFNIYSLYNVLVYRYYEDCYGWVDLNHSPQIAHFIEIDYWDYDTFNYPTDIVVYYKAKVSNKIVMVEGINYYWDVMSGTWNYHHLWWEYL